MEGRVSWQPNDPDRLARQVERWRSAGATHLTIDTMYTGQATVADHVRAIRTRGACVWRDGLTRGARRLPVRVAREYSFR